MIHACPQRMWYVKEFLVPSMLAQGIREEEIEIRCDTEGKGNLFSCMERFRSCGERAAESCDPESGTWHLQDDVLICRDFAERTGAQDSGIVCGFACRNFGPSMQERGRMPVGFMWYSFQCTRIPDSIAGECADWFFSEAQYYPKYQTKVAEKMHDDQFFRDFLAERHGDLWITNLAPNLVEHIDWLIGGTTINQMRAFKTNRAEFWEDEALVKELEEALHVRNGTKNQ